MANRLLSQQSTVHSPQYTYDPIGNRLTLTDSAGLHTYTYDPLSQLTNADYPAGFAAADTTFTYDPVGNRTQVVDGGTTPYTPNSLNQYTVVGTTNLSYDPNGNLANDGQATYTYDAENRLTIVNRQSSISRTIPLAGGSARPLTAPRPASSMMAIRSSQRRMQAARFRPSTSTAQGSMSPW